MENASKALLMAAGVLIGVLILTTMIVLFTTFGDLGREYNARKASQEIQKFNSQFTKYENVKLKAQDLQTIKNLVDEWNKTGTNEKIEISGINDINTNFLSEKNNEIQYTNGAIKYITFKMTIEDYYTSGRISKIELNENFT